MTAVIRHMLRRSRGATIGWGLAIGLLAFLMAQFYDTLAVQRDMIEKLVSGYPRELMAFFGGGTADIFSPQGYLSMEFFSMMQIVLGIYAVLSGSGLLVGDEEAGILDLLLAHPVSRSRFFLGRVAAAALGMAAILGAVWAAFLVGVARSKNLDLSALEILRPIIDLYVLVFLFEALSLFLSLLLPSRNAAAMVSGLLLVGSYFVNALAEFSEPLDRLADFLPMRYYQSGYAIDGLKADWLLGLSGFAALFLLLAWILFVRRDIRVSGEGSWRLPARPGPGRHPRGSGARS